MKYKEDEEFERKLEEVYKVLTSYRVIYRYIKLDSAVDIGDYMMLIDLERAEIDEMEWKSSTNKGNAGGLLCDLQLNRQYEDEARQGEKERLKEKAEAKAGKRHDGKRPIYHSSSIN
ncbi:6e8cc959-193f-4803-ba11-ef44bf4c8140-CDS [Sclerotinia trifoliorum]|uniref:6e8cc959-193f-4803-ba11-ef44bf4c8140-CDS n=1 Tax=Sclerotinia trifoliorum TaxID=28548 RepID=A0A8H2VYX2_9HELO|nr:6e8cc959-193f-4803-ba11-ef44bf4c8140-CDS [Sclerotinia trifoliorum]